MASSKMLCLAVVASFLGGSLAATTTILNPKTDTIPSCKQTTIPPGVKPFACMDVICSPQGVEVGTPFHTTIKFCLQRARKWNMTFGLLTMDTHSWLGGTGYELQNKDGDSLITQCGIHTFEYTMSEADFGTNDQMAAIGDYMWKYFITPVWGQPGEEVTDPFPNMLAECGIPVQPVYGTASGDCPVRENVSWTAKKTRPQDAINYYMIPQCMTPGQPWQISVETHLESKPAADLHFNLQIGTGADKYLGVADIFVDEFVVYGYAKNGPWGYGKYWTYTNATFTAEATANITNGDLPYIATFFTPAGQQYGSVKTGYTFLEREFFLHVELC